MSTTNERLEKLFETPRRNRRTLATPEGVPLELTVAGCGERLIAFGLDLGIVVGGMIILSLLAASLMVSGEGSAMLKAFIQFAAFAMRTCYFAGFELIWQGRTPGKKACGLRVINRAGGELTAGAVIARNLVREAEFFLPLALLLSLDADTGLGGQFALAGWAALGGILPLLNRDRLRPGDLIAGTQVIAAPKRTLLGDLSMQRPAKGKTEPDTFVFTRAQLSKYGAFELQVLEELLRRPAMADTKRLLDDVSERIRKKIGWIDPVAPKDTRRFLTAFYAAEREELERGKLFGRLREDKNDIEPRR